MDDSEIDQIVVKRVFDRCHSYIADAISGVALPAEFLGALTANESGGRPGASCFEPAVYHRLRAVADGQLPAFGSIAWQQLSSALHEIRSTETRMIEAPLEDDEERAKEIERVITGPEDRGLRDLATSWGFTQIMGYHVAGRKMSIQSLLDPHFHYRLAVEILGDFARRFRLQLSRDFESLFRCWNTGQPDGKTFDPDYVGKGMRRMNLYHKVMQEAVHEGA